MCDLIEGFLREYDLAQANGAPADPALLARLIFDRWNARYFDFIKDDDMVLTTHEAHLRRDAKALVALVFAPSFAAQSPLRAGQAAE